MLEPGFYWVRFETKWVVAALDFDGKWYFPAPEESITPDEIGDKVERPEKHK